MANSTLVTTAAANTQANAATADIITGTAGADAYIFASNGVDTGDDVLADFGTNDSLLSTKKIFDSNNDGIIMFGGNGVLDIDRTSGWNAGPDQITVNGIQGNKGLRYLGEKEGYFVYADATVRPKGAIEGKVSDDNLVGNAAKAETFFYDTALGLNLGGDTISSFGANDRIVTTSKIYDSNNNDIITFGTNDVLDLPGASGGVSTDPGGGPGGQLSFTGEAGQSITALDYDGSVVGANGVTYYIYSMVGGAADLTVAA